MSREFYEISDHGTFYSRAAGIVIDSGREALRDHGYYTIVLTGGRTVKGLYKCLAEISSLSEIKNMWGKTYFFLGDERWVPAGHPDSNGSMARRLLLDPAMIADDRIYMIPTGVETSAAAATIYEDTIRSFFAERARSRSGQLPVFDMVLLSMGTDGHIASLFQGTEALAEKQRWVTTSSEPRTAPRVERITITLPVINNAGTVLMLVSGSEKSSVARQIIAEPSEAANVYPAALVNPAGRDIWMVDEG